MSGSMGWKKVLIVAMCWLLAWQAQAQELDSILAPPVEVQTEQATVEAMEEEEDDVSTSYSLIPPIVPPVPDTLVNHLLKDEKLAYLQKSDSLMRALNQQMQKMPEDVKADDIDISFTWVRPLLWTLAILAVLYLLYMVTLGRGRLFAPANTTAAADTNLQQPDEPEETDPDKKALAAIARGEYRPAVRFLFIDALNRLDEKGIINKAPRKTNLDYLQETSNEQCRQQLAELMLRFEYVWYGQFTPDQQQFDSIHQMFKRFYSQWC
ncbi:MAG: DUF4129 domain-containing protein [Chitinophagaceae bacterium]|nr:DUF4129 domain-containing protein [Chitinophagaceae bacterium]